MERLRFNLAVVVVDAAAAAAAGATFSVLITSLVDETFVSFLRGDNDVDSPFLRLLRIGDFSLAVVALRRDDDDDDC